MTGKKRTKNEHLFDEQRIPAEDKVHLLGTSNSDWKKCNFCHVQFTLLFGSTMPW